MHLPAQSLASLSCDEGPKNTYLEGVLQELHIYRSIRAISYVSKHIEDMQLNTAVTDLETSFRGGAPAWHIQGPGFST